MSATGGRAGGRAHIDLFAGIGGFSLAAQWAGFTTVLHCEIDAYCQKVLTKHWPGVPIHGDIRTFDGTEWCGVALLTAGFPCQPVSGAGRKRAQKDDRWLWPEVARVIREIRPRYALMENVPGLFAAGFGDVLGDLAACGYDAEWDCLSASAVGAPHERERVFIVAHPNGVGYGAGFHSHRDDAISDGSHWQAAQGKSKWQDMERWIGATVQNGEWSDADAPLLGVDDGLSRSLDRVRALGNAVVPQQVYPILAAIAATLAAPPAQTEKDVERGNL